jgi:hypothetical protein
MQKTEAVLSPNMAKRHKRPKLRDKLGREHLTKLVGLSS